MAQMSDAFDILKRPEGGVEVRLQFALGDALETAAA